MTPANNPASIHQRILNRAMAERRTFNELLQYYAMERFLYRLGKSPYCEDFVLKGALVFLAWHVPLTRPTRDMDFLGFTSNSVDNLVEIVRQICAQPVEEDGILFVSASVQGEEIQEEASYQGVRVRFLGLLGSAELPMRLDVGFADIVTPDSTEIELPTILDHMSQPRIRAYPPETVIAEKLQAIVSLGMINSRMKDFYDLWFMASSMEFDFALLRQAVTNTFVRRKTAFPEATPTGFTEQFAEQKQKLWKGFLKKNQIGDAPDSLIQVLHLLNEFLDPIMRSTGNLRSHWSPQSGWRS